MVKKLYSNKAIILALCFCLVFSVVVSYPVQAHASSVALTVGSVGALCLALISSMGVNIQTTSAESLKTWISDKLTTYLDGTTLEAWLGISALSGLASFSSAGGISVSASIYNKLLQFIQPLVTSYSLNVANNVYSNAQTVSYYNAFSSAWGTMYYNNLGLSPETTYTFIVRDPLYISVKRSTWSPAIPNENTLISAGSVFSVTLGYSGQYQICNVKGSGYIDVVIPNSATASFTSSSEVSSLSSIDSDEEYVLDIPLSGSLENTLDSVYTGASASGGITIGSGSVESQSVLDKISAIPTAIGNKLTELFVPSQSYMDALPNTLYTTFGQRVGFLTYPFTVLTDFITSVSQITVQEPIFSWGNIREPFSNVILIHSGSYNLNSLKTNTQLNNLYNIYLVVIKGLIAFAFLSLCYKKYEQIIHDGHIGGDA